MGLKSLLGFGNYSREDSELIREQNKKIAENKWNIKSKILDDQSKIHDSFIFKTIFLENNWEAFFQWSIKELPKFEFSKHCFNRRGDVKKQWTHLFDEQKNRFLNENGFIKNNGFHHFEKGLNFIIKDILKNEELAPLVIDRVQIGWDDFSWEGLWKMESEGKENEGFIKPGDCLRFENGLMFDCKTESIENFAERYFCFLNKDNSNFEFKNNENMSREQKLKQLELLKLKQQQLELEIDLGD